MIDVKETMGNATEIKRNGFYKPSRFSKQSAKERRAFLEDFIEALDEFIPTCNDMSLDMLNDYNDLRGNIMWLIDKECNNVRFGE